MTEALFPINDDELLINVYQKQGRTLDDLPYTDEFETLYTSMYGPDGRDAPNPAEQTRAKVFHRLHNLRKAGKLPKLGRAKSSPPRIEPEQEQQLVAIVEEHIGQISKRDQLLYQPTFDEIVDTFNAATGLSLSPHDLWRIIAKLAK
ncbi:MAG: hypothetical protein AAGA25_04310 [Planctomycetota bacterium]